MYAVHDDDTKTMRLNASPIECFEFANKTKILHYLYPMMSGLFNFVTEQQFKDLYDYATTEPLDALIIDASKGEPIFQKNFESILYII
jgi:hypothetical protein